MLPPAPAFSPAICQLSHHHQSPLPSPSLTDFPLTPSVSGVVSHSHSVAINNLSVLSSVALPIPSTPLIMIIILSVIITLPTDIITIITANITSPSNTTHLQHFLLIKMVISASALPSPKCLQHHVYHPSSIIANIISILSI